MYSLETIIAINNRPQKLKTAIFHRDSSFCKSRGGFVIHSAAHRSTSFIDPVDHPESHAAFSYWSRQGQAAVNAFVPTLVQTGNLSAAEHAAFKATRPNWTVRELGATGKTKGKPLLTACRKENGFETYKSAYSWKHLHAFTQ